MDRQIKKDIAVHYKAELNDLLFVHSIRFRRTPTGIKMTVKGGIDGNASCSIVADSPLHLFPLANEEDTALRLHSITQYFIRYNIAYRLKRIFMAVTNHCLKDIGVKLEGYNVDLKAFTRYEVIWFYKDGSHIIEQYKGNPLNFEEDYIQNGKLSSIFNADDITSHESYSL